MLTALVKSVRKKNIFVWELILTEQKKPETLSRILPWFSGYSKSKHITSKNEKEKKRDVKTNWSCTTIILNLTSVYNFHLSKSLNFVLLSCIQDLVIEQDQQDVAAWRDHMKLRCTGALDKLLDIRIVLNEPSWSLFLHQITRNSRNFLLEWSKK